MEATCWQHDLEGSHPETGHSPGIADLILSNHGITGASSLDNDQFH